MAEYNSSTVSSILRSSLASPMSLVRITVNMPSIMVSTTSAWCSASRAAHEMASDGVDSADGSRWRGRSAAPAVGWGLGSSRCTSRATQWVRPIKPILMTMLNARWNSTTFCVSSGSSGRTWRSHWPMNGATSATPSILNIRLPTVTWRTSMVDLAVVMTASSPLPRLAPSTKPSATSSGTTLALAIAATSSTMARLE